jgi:hypothetical protein
VNGRTWVKHRARDGQSSAGEGGDWNQKQSETYRRTHWFGKNFDGHIRVIFCDIPLTDDQKEEKKPDGRLTRDVQ